MKYDVTARERRGLMASRHPKKQMILIMGTASFDSELADLPEETGLYELEAFFEEWDRQGTKKLWESELFFQITSQSAAAFRHRCRSRFHS